MRLYIKVLIIAIALTSLIPAEIDAASWPAGYIVLQVQEHGEAYYLYPRDSRAYYLGRPADAFSIMTSLALGAKHDFIINTEIFPQSLAGMILLDVEENGEAYYIYPKDRRKYYLGRPDDAFKVMRELGLGITNRDLSFMQKGELSGLNNFTMNNLESVYIDNVPFVAQAPLGDWADQRQAEGCEEASVLMAVRWAHGQSLSADEAVGVITAAADYTMKKYGEFRDTSINDTAEWLVKDYFGYKDISIRKDVTVERVVQELKNGNLVIAAFDGQLVHNPYFRGEGPSRHMLVIRGYDAETNEFITNDPGTSHGENFRYNATEFFEAMRDYPTGFHVPFSEVNKDVIVLFK